MSFRLTLISHKEKLSPKDEQYIINGLRSGKLHSNEVMSYVDYPTTAILETLYELCNNQNDINRVVAFTPYRAIKQINNVSYVQDLIRSNYDNFDRINFDKFRTNERILDYAKILQTYEAALSYTVSCLTKEEYSPLTKDEKEELDTCRYILHDMQDSFDTANLLLSGKLDPKTINLGKDKKTESTEDSEPESL